MTDPAQLLEDRLTQGYAAQVAHYDDALRLLNRLPAQAPLDLTEESWILELQIAMQAVGAVDAAIAVDKRAWQEAARAAGAPFRATLKALEQRIRALAEIVDQRIASLKAKREQMMPQLDSFIRQRRMLKAYDAYGRLDHETANGPASSN